MMTADDDELDGIFRCLDGHRVSGAMHMLCNAVIVIAPAEAPARGSVIRTLRRRPPTETAFELATAYLALTTRCIRESVSPNPAFP